MRLWVTDVYHLEKPFIDFTYLQQNTFLQQHQQKQNDKIRNHIELINLVTADYFLPPPFRLKVVLRGAFRPQQGCSPKLFDRSPRPAPEATLLPHWWQ